MSELSRLTQAMHDGKCVSFVYDNKSRVVEVHAIGKSTKDGSIVFRGYQVSGEASRPLPQWTLFSLAKVVALHTSAVNSQAPREGYSQGDKQMASIIAELAL